VPAVQQSCATGLLDDLLWNLGPEMPTFVGRRARKVLREGTAAEATVVGIRVERTDRGHRRG